MPSYDELESVTTKFGSSNGREEWIAVGASPFSEPDFQNLERCLSQRCTALLSPLALTADVSSCSGHNIATAEADEFRRSQACLEGNDEDDMVATPGPCGAIGRGQQRIHLLTIQELHRPPHIALARHGQDSLAMKHVRGLAHGHEPEEGPDCGKTDIAAAGAITAFAFDVGEEVAHNGGVYIFYPQLRRDPTGLF